MLRLEKDHVKTTAMDMVIEERGRPGKHLKRWLECEKEDLVEKGLKEQVATDCQCWRAMTEIMTLLEVRKSRKGERRQQRGAKER